MYNSEKNRSKLIWAGVGFTLWLIINIRVAAGVGTPFERAIDGLVGGAVLLIAIFLSLKYFKCDKDACGNGKKCLKQ